MSKPNGVWIFCELTGDFGSPVRIQDVDGNEIVLDEGRIGFVDFPLEDGRFESRLAVLGSVVSSQRGFFRLRFHGGREGVFAPVVGWQLEFDRTCTVGVAA